jgi:hypothetical protein
MRKAEPEEILGLPEQRRTRDLKAYIEQLVPQMIVVEDETRLLKACDTDIRDCIRKSREDPRIEIRVSKSLPEPPGTDFYDAIEKFLNRSRQGTIGMKTEDASQTFFDCDVKNPTKAALAVLKGLKSLGYTHGVEVYTGEPEQKTLKLEPG